MKSTSPIKSARASLAAGFSLVEVVIATGIAAMGVTTLFALLPMGMNIFRESMEVSVSAQIGEALIREAQGTDYTSLLTTATATAPASGSTTPVMKPVRYFTDQGIETAFISQSVYHAYTRIVPTTGLPNAGATSQWPGVTLATVTVQVVVNPSNRAINVNPVQAGALAGMIVTGQGLTIFTYSGHLAKIK